MATELPNGTFKGRVKGAGFLPVTEVTRSFDSKEKAEEWEHSRRVMVKARIMIPECVARLESAGVNGRSKITLGGVIRMYCKAQAISSADDGYLGVLLNDEKFCETLLAEADVDWALKWIANMKRVKHLKPGTIRHYVGAMMRCLDFCVIKKATTGYGINALKLLPRNASKYSDEDIKIAGIDPEAAFDEERDRRLSKDEEAAILKVIAETTQREYRPHSFADAAEDRVFVLLALETCMRMRELYTLAPEQIDLERRTIFLRRTKNGKQRQVPMTSVAVELLRQHKAHSKQLFRYWSGTFDCKDLCNDSALLSIYFAKIFEQAGCPDLHFHDLRHEATSRLFERTTLREVEIMKITGHSSTKMLGRYANLRASNLATALW